MTNTVIITVVVILGIIIAGGFLLYFMGDIIMSLANRKKDDKTIEVKKDKETEKLRNEIENLGEDGEQLKNVPEIADLLYSGAIVENYDPEAEAEETSVEEEEVESAEEEEVEEEEDEEVEETTEDKDSYIEQRRRELMERLARMAEASDDEEEEEEYEEEEEVEETSDEEVEENEEEAETEETLDISEETSENEVVEEEEEELQEETENVEEEDEEMLTEELAKAREELNAERTRNAALMAELNAKRAMLAGNEDIVYDLNELEEKLVVAEEKLKANEKELRACKKEFVPLRRVKKTLENDEKKLRRKEALVAKQKVVLYGVNNYADIDEEKAKKLSEDLDLLDGLKLSVEHCQEVMTKNAERYPLLEKIYNVLTTQNAEIKAEIEKIQDQNEKAKKDNK